MEKKLMMIGNEKGFMVHATVTALEKAGYEVMCVNPDIDEIHREKYFPDIWILYVEELDEELHKVITYCKDTVGGRGAFFYLIGNPEDLKEVQKVVPESLIKRAFERPLNNADLIKELDRLVQRDELGEIQRSILIVDDDPTMVRMIKNLLSEKYKIYMANSGMNAITLLVKNKVDLILLDYEMPVVDGSQVLEMIRSEPTTKDTPVIMLTAKDDKESVMKVLELKPEKYLLKSMPPNMWVKEIDDYFRSLM
ncbi:MAG: response regulator [Eubacterium sp.]|nr:response regulator [Eubacterium sp.]